MRKAGEPLPRVLVCNAWLVASTLVTMVHAQLDVPVSIEMTGTTTDARQVSGLAEPIAPDAIMNLASVRGQATTMAMVTGEQVLTGDLSPAPDGLVPGMVLTIVPAVDNAEAPVLALNGLAPFPVHDAGGTALVAGALRPAVPVRLLFTGTAFVLAGSMGTACPAGFSAPSPRFCVADSAAQAMNFFEANLHCRAQGRRLCSFGEWTAACRTMPGFFATVDEAEWVDHAANLVETAKYLGYGENGQSAGAGEGCDFGGYAPAATGSFRVRCCVDR